MNGKLDNGEDDRSKRLRRAWELSVLLLAGKVPKVTFETYIRPTYPISYIGDLVTLAVQSDFAREWLEKKASNQIRSALEFHLDACNLQLKFVIQTADSASRYLVRAANPKPNSAQTALQLDLEGDCEAESASGSQERAKSGRGSGASSSTLRKSVRDGIIIPGIELNSRYVFDNFLSGKSNRLAYASALAVSEKPGAVYNPLFVYGGPGLGKTHLMQAIAHSLKRSTPELRVAYVSGEFFTQQYVTAIRERTTEEFRKQYRQIDVWIVDDIQFIAGKEHSKEEFFYTFNALYQAGKQIVIGSDRSPRELNTLDERLRSRFQSGLIADIGAPDIETRIAFLQKCRERENIPVSNDVLDYIADAIQSNMRTLEGALTRLVAYSSIMNAPMNAELAQSVLSEYFIHKPIRATRLTVDEVIMAVSEKTNISPAAIKGTSRQKEVALARHIAMLLCRDLLPELNTMLLGKAFGGKDHATIVHACQRMRMKMENDTELKTLINGLLRSFAK